MLVKESDTNEGMHASLSSKGNNVIQIQVTYWSNYLIASPIG